MTHLEQAPFELGKTWYNGGTIASDNLGGVELEGQERWFKDYNLASTDAVKPIRTEFLKKCRAVRNSATIALLAKRAVSWESGKVGQRVDGYVKDDNQAVAGIVDEWLPTAGVPANDVFWLTVEGPTLILTDLAAGVRNVFSVGHGLAAVAAGSSQAAAAGRLGVVALSTGATSQLFNALLNTRGRALTARTTDNTNLDTLAYLNGGQVIF